MPGAPLGRGARGLRRRAGDRARLGGPGCGELRAEVGRAGVLRALGEYDEAQVRYERARDLAVHPTIWRAAERLARAGGPGDASRSKRGGERRSTSRPSASAEALGEDRDVSRTCSAYGATLLKLGRYDEAQAQNERAVEISRRIGDRVGEAYAVGTSGQPAHRRARLRGGPDLPGTRARHLAGGRRPPRRGRGPRQPGHGAAAPGRAGARARRLRGVPCPLHRALGSRRGGLGDAAPGRRGPQGGRAGAGARALRAGAGSGAWPGRPLDRGVGPRQPG